MDTNNNRIKHRNFRNVALSCCSVPPTRWQYKQWPQANLGLRALVYCVCVKFCLWLKQKRKYRLLCVVSPSPWKAPFYSSLSYAGHFPAQRGSSKLHPQHFWEMSRYKEQNSAWSQRSSVDRWLFLVTLKPQQDYLDLICKRFDKGQTSAFLKSSTFGKQHVY